MHVCVCFFTDVLLIFVVYKICSCATLGWKYAFMLFLFSFRFRDICMNAYVHIVLAMAMNFWHYAMNEVDLKSRCGLIK